MKKVIIDCRYLGLSGIGRFLENLLANLNKSKFDYTLLGKKELVNKYDLNFIEDNSNPYSIKGMFSINKDINKYDIYLTCNFIIPFGIKIKSYIVLHDVIFLDIKESNKNYFEYLFKYFMINRGIKKSAYVYTVSNFSKNRIINYFPKYKSKIKYEYQGISDEFKSQTNVNKKDYILYIGNIKKHKGIRTLIEAYDSIINYKLIIVGEEKLMNKDHKSLSLIHNKNIKFTGKVSDELLIDYIKYASFVIVPSIYEGFGLVPLEALYLNTKPIISDIEVFKEVYSKLDVIYFKVNNHNDLASKINTSSRECNSCKDVLDKMFSSKRYMKMIEDDFDE